MIKYKQSKSFPIFGIFSGCNDFFVLYIIYFIAANSFFFHMDMIHFFGKNKIEMHFEKKNSSFEKKTKI